MGDIIHMASRKRVNVVNGTVVVYLADLELDMRPGGTGREALGAAEAAVAEALEAVRAGRAKTLEAIARVEHLHNFHVWELFSAQEGGAGDCAMLVRPSGWEYLLAEMEVKPATLHGSVESAEIDFDDDLPATLRIAFR